MTPDELATALRQGTEGYSAPTAAVELLIAHDYWVRRMAFYPKTLHVDQLGDVDWVDLAQAIARGEIHASSSQLRILAIACSLVGALLPFDLRERLTGLDETNLRLVLAAVARANGRPEVFPSALHREAAARRGPAEAKARSRVDRVRRTVDALATDPPATLTAWDVIREVRIALDGPPNGPDGAENGADGAGT